MAGRKFGKLTVVEMAQERTSSFSVKWICKCDCGNECVVRGSSLRNGHTRSCGCAHKEGQTIKDEIGTRYGRLQVLSITNQRSKDGVVKWLCKCDCGKETIVPGSQLRSGHTQSCGCLQHELTTKHGMWRSNTYRIWAGMKSRCNNTKAKFYKYYGGRGIKVCDRWHSFENFLADMGERPSKELSLDRIDNNGNYELGNCRWATAKEQLQNRRPFKRKPK